MLRRRRAPRPAPFRADPPRLAKRRPVMPPLLVLPLAALLLTACSAGEEPGVATAGGKGATPTASASADRQQSLLAYAKCMRENGVNMPDPQPGQDGAARLTFDRGSVPAETLRKAQRACGKHLEGTDVARRLQDPEVQQKLLDFARCMRQNGVNMPDPDVSGGGAGADREKFMKDPDWEAARQTCRKHIDGLVKTRGGS